MVRLVMTIALVLAVGSTTAHARRIVIMEPPVAYRCRTAKTWPAVEKCLLNIGKPTVIKTVGTTRLVSITSLSAKQQIGIYLYLETKTDGWRLAGMYEGDGIDLFDLAAVTINKHRGYRIDFGQTFRSGFLDADGQGRPATTRLVNTLYCGGDTYTCASISTLCEVVVSGRVVELFRGTASIVDNQIVVEGDRRYSGNGCRVTDRAFLGWAPN